MATHSYFPWSVSSLFSICSAPARRTGGTERERKGTKMFSGVCRKKKWFFSRLSAPLRILWTFHPEMFIRLVCCRCILTLGYPLFYPIKNSLCYHLCEAPSERPSLSNTNQLYFLLSFPMKRTENGDPFQSEMSSIKFRS